MAADGVVEGGAFDFDFFDGFFAEGVDVGGDLEFDGHLAFELLGYGVEGVFFVVAEVEVEVGPEFYEMGRGGAK